MGIIDNLFDGLGKALSPVGKATENVLNGLRGKSRSHGSHTPAERPMIDFRLASMRGTPNVPDLPGPGRFAPDSVSTAEAERQAEVARRTPIYGGIFEE